MPVLAVIAAALALASCGDDGGGAREAAAPGASSFPAAGGRTLEKVATDEAGGVSQEIVASPAGRVFRPGENRFGFGIFTVAREQIEDAEAAVYVARGATGQAKGPFPARVESLATEAPFTSRTSAGDPDAATAIYVTEIDVPRTGEWRLLALVRDGDTYTASRMPSIDVGSYRRVPAPGGRAPLIRTPTVDDVGEISSIETRIPPDTMHSVDYADALGERPIVVLFATPALCQSRVCGPVVDIAEQVKSEFDGEDVAFIHMEVYRENQIDRGIRSQLRAFGLTTEPWLFVIDRSGRVSAAIEGGFSAGELTGAVREVAG